MRRLFRLPWRSRARIRDDVDEEIAFHLDMRAEELIRRHGLGPAEARARAESEFGDLRRLRRELQEEDRRIERRFRWRSSLEGLLTDLRFAFRALWKRPGFSGLAVVTIALGIGVTTLVFTVVDGVLLRPLPYPGSDRIMNVWQVNESWMDADNPMLRAFARSFPASYPVYEDWTAMVRSFEAVGAFRDDRLSVTGGDRPERVSAIRATSGVFRTLGTAPALGRVPSEEEDRVGGPSLAVLSDGFWRRRFGGDPGILGEVLPLEGEAYTVVGVMPSEFQFPDPDAELWLTFRDEMRLSDRGSQGLQVIARLGSGVDPESAARELDAVTARIAEAHPETQASLRARLGPRRDEVVGGARASLVTLLAGAVLVLLVASANVMNLLFVRATRRGGELAVRSALGAGRGRIARSMLAESAVVAAVGGALGVLLALLLLEPLVTLLPASIPRTGEITLDGRILAFAATVTGGAVLLAGGIPALIAARAHLGAALQGAGRTIGGGRRLGGIQSAVVVAELSAAVVLLVAAGLLGRSLERMGSVNPGFEADGVVLAELSLPATGTRTAASFPASLRGIRERVATLPGVEDVGLADAAPFFGGSSSGTLEVESEAGEVVSDNVALSAVGHGYFEAFRIPLLRGRTFGPVDGDEEPHVAVVSRSFAERHWPGLDPLGRRLRDPPETEWRTVVGVVEDVRHRSLTEGSQPRVYRTMSREDDLDEGSFVLAVRASGDPSSIVAAIRPAIWEVEPTLPVPNVVRLTDAVDGSLAEPRFRALLIGTLALLAAVLAVAGVYGLVAFSVARRTREMGVRLALGASPQRLTWEVVGSALRLAGLGLLVGIPAALAAGRGVRGFLFEVSGAEPLILGAAAAVVAATAGVAAWIPARRAARIDATTALRVE